MKIYLSLIVSLVVLTTSLIVAIDRNKKLKEENNMYLQNIESLYGINQQLTDTTARQARAIQTLRLTKDELLNYKDDAEKTISEMGLKIKNLTAIGRHNLSVNIPVKGKIDIEPPDTASVRMTIKDTVPFKATINISKPFLHVSGSIVADSIDINIKTEVKLDQVFTKIPKHKFLFWSWGIKGVQQTIKTDNPYVNIKYSEFIEIR